MFPHRSTTWPTETVPLHVSSEHSRNCPSLEACAYEVTLPIRVTCVPRKHVPARARCPSPVLERSAYSEHFPWGYSLGISLTILLYSFSHVYRSRYSGSLGTEQPRGRDSSPGSIRHFLFSASSMPALGPTQPPIQCVPGALFPEHSPQTTAKPRKCG
jgi:hypothetical protein